MKLLFRTLFLFPLLLGAQSNSANALLLQLKGAKEDTAKVRIQLALADMYYYKSIDTMSMYSNRALELIKGLPEKLKNQTEPVKLKAWALANLGLVFQTKEDIGSARDYFEQAYRLRESVNDKAGVTDALANLGSLYLAEGNYIKSIECFSRSLKGAEELKDEGTMASCYINLGYIYQAQGEITNALSNYRQCMALREKLKNQPGIAGLCNIIGVMYLYKGDPEYTGTAAENKISSIKKAREYFNRSLAIGTAIESKRLQAEALNNLGLSYYKEDNAVMATDYFNKSLKMRDEKTDRTGIVSTLVNMNGIYLKQKNYAKALEYGLKANALVEGSKNLEMKNYCNKILYLTYKEMKDHSMAVKYYEKYIQTNDSIVNIGNKKAAVKSQLKYEYEKKSAADSVKNAEAQKVKDAQLAAQNASLKQEKTQRYFLIGGLVFVACGLAFVINRFRITNKQKKIIEEQKVVVDEAFNKLHEKNKEVMDSIYYARRIQRALITNEKYFAKNINRLSKN